jgi:DNA integrity scanning protein DisA with diadenylate cyclase activity
MSDTKQPSKVETEKVFTVQDYYDLKTAEAKKRVKEIKPLETVSLTEKINVRFIANFGDIKKGHEQKISKVAYEIYERNKVVEKI